MSKKNVLVTGGAGYIGAHTCKALKKAGHNPVTVDNLVYGHKSAVKWGPFYEVDVRDTSALTPIFKKEKIDAVIHFASYAYVGESMLDPLKYYDNNLVGALSLFTAMKEANVKKIVFSSSCATYGEPKQSPIVEETLQNPINPYGRTKLIIENILKDLSVADGFRSVCLRYFNAAGADPELETGEDHTPETHVIPLMIEAAFHPEKLFKVFGTNYPTPDGTCIRDYIHVTDLADAHVKALESLEQKPADWRAYNLGTGRGSSVKDLVIGLEKLTGRKLNTKYVESRLGDPPALVASSLKAQKELGWTPRHSSLEEILQTAMSWYEKHHLKNAKK